jgi:fucose permease
LHSCLGIGTAIGPIAFIFFLEHAQWWYDGVLIGSLYFLLLLSVFALFPNPCHITKEKTGKSTLPFSSFALWGFIAIGLLYGICETTFGNWGTIFLHQDKSLSVTSAAIALSLFWGALTFGRILTVIFSFFISTRIIYCTLPPIMFLSIVFLYLASQESWLLSCFALAGLGCSAMLPLTIGFAQERFTTIAPLISGMIIGIYMLGFGLASQGIGLIHKLSHLSYSKLFASLSGPIFVLIALCIGISLGKKKGAKSN